MTSLHRAERSISLFVRGPLSALIAFLAVVTVGWGVSAMTRSPAAASVVAVAPIAQSLVVSASVPVPVVVRDGYGITDPPRLAWPVDALGPIADGFGARMSPCRGCSSFHEGVDFDAGDGTVVRAIASGTVVAVSRSGGLGEHVILAHEIDGVAVSSVYAHLRAGSVVLAAGSAVAIGDKIGLVGDTGASTGPHLHLEIRVAGRAVDPLAWMHARLG